MKISSLVSKLLTICLDPLLERKQLQEKHTSERCVVKSYRIDFIDSLPSFVTFAANPMSIEVGRAGRPACPGRAGGPPLPPPQQPTRGHGSPQSNDGHLHSPVTGVPPTAGRGGRQVAPHTCSKDISVFSKGQELRACLVRKSLQLKGSLIPHGPNQTSSQQSSQMLTTCRAPVT